jgi:hypothetical protein
LKPHKINIRKPLSTNSFCASLPRNNAAYVDRFLCANRTFALFQQHARSDRKAFAHTL